MAIAEEDYVWAGGNVAFARNDSIPKAIDVVIRDDLYDDAPTADEVPRMKPLHAPKPS